MPRKKSSKTEIEHTISSYSPDIASVLSALANDTRLRILKLTLHSACDFKDLVLETKLSKAALAKHIRILSKSGLLRKVERGVYEITDDGSAFLSSISIAYEDSLRRQQEDLLRRRRLYSPISRKEEEVMDKFIVENQAEYQPAWISYLSMTTGILKALGANVDVTDVGGYTGQAFHLNTARDSTCPSAPTVADFHTFAQGLESMGWKVDQSWYPPGCSFPMNEEETARAKNHFEILKKEMMRSKQPIGIWGTYVPEFGIMNGFDGDSYVVSSFRKLQGIDEPPIKFNELKPPGGFFKQVFKEPIKIKDQSAVDKKAIRRALKVAEGFAKSDAETHKNYASGIEMFDQLSQILKKGVVPSSEKSMEKMDSSKAPFLLYHGNSYTAMCNQEALALAHEFLGRLAKRYKGKSMYEPLKQASLEYEKAASLMKEYTELFPFSFEKDYDASEFTDDKRARGIALLNEAKPHVVAALKHMKDALKDW